MESRPTFRQWHGTLGDANESPSSRSTDSVAVSQPRQSHTRGQLRHTVHSPPCLNLLSSCHAHSGPFCLLERRVPPGSRLAWVAARGVAKWHSVDRRCTWFSSVQTKLPIATPTRRPFSGHGGHALSWQSRQQPGCLPVTSSPPDSDLTR